MSFMLISLTSCPSHIPVFYYFIFADQCTLSEIIEAIIEKGTGISKYSLVRGIEHYADQPQVRT